MNLRNIIAAAAISASALFAATGSTTDLTFSGIRSSNLGFNGNFPTPDEAANVMQNIAEKLGSTTPSAVWIVGLLGDDGECNLEFSGSSNDPYINFVGKKHAEEHEAYLSRFDEIGAKVFLQVEAGMADMKKLIDVVMDKYGDHECVAGFGIDVEWYPSWGTTNGVQGGEDDELTKSEILELDTYLKSKNQNWRLFVKHWEPIFCGATSEDARDQGVSDVIYIDDSQEVGSLEDLAEEFEWWAGIFSNNDVGFQIGYPNDQSWWSGMSDPIGEISAAIKKKIKNQKVHIYWVDFTIRNNKFNDLWNAPDGKYDVSVSGGTGSGRYLPGDNVEIVADDSENFLSWTATGVTLGDVNSASTSFTMPNNPVNIIANVKGEIPEKGNDLVYWEDWEASAGDKAGDATSSDKNFDNKNGIIGFDMTTKSAYEGDCDDGMCYPWANIANYFEHDNGDFADVSSIDITYSSNEDIEFVLVDTKGYAEEGMGFTYTLRSTNGAQVTQSLNPLLFERITDWEDDTRAKMTNDDKQFIQGVSFGISSDMSAKGQITKLLINNLRTSDDPNPITHKPTKITKTANNFVSLNARTLNLSIPAEKTALIQIVDLRGRLLLGKEITLTNGTAGIKLPKSIAGNQMILVNIYGKNGNNFSRKLLVK